MSEARPRRRRAVRTAVGDVGSGTGDVEQAVNPQEPTGQLHGVDLNSKSATSVANIVFRRPQQHNFPLVQFDCHDCLETSQYIREWIQFVTPHEARSLVRIEDQKLDLIASNTKGVLMLAESAANLEGDPAAPVSLLSLYIPEDKHIRYFWTLISPSELLVELTRREFIGSATTIPYYDNPPARSKNGDVLPSRHHMLFTLLAQSFHMATTFPESPAYRTASLISDVCPSIIDPETAHRRIEAENDLHVSHGNSANGKDLSDDRYTLELHPAERALTALVNTCCAEYLLIKRQYFKAFSRETILLAEKVRRAAAQQRNSHRSVGPIEAADDSDENDQLLNDTANSTPMTTRSRARSTSVSSSTQTTRRASATYHAARSRAAHTGARNRALRVRTKHAHVRNLETQTGWNPARAKKLVRGWEILGFLNEERVLAVLDGGDVSDGESE